jgi:hypothetical protein
LTQATFAVDDDAAMILRFRISAKAKKPPAMGAGDRRAR